MANKRKDVVFDLVDEATVKRLRRTKTIKLPKKKISIPKDMRWNKKEFHSAVLAGIENGESVDKIASRILPEIMSKTDFDGKTAEEIYGKGGIIAKNRDSAIRNARTMVTSAENHGRLDSYNELDKQGVVQKKVWEATADDRTRPSHIDLDGEEQDINDMFSNGCMYPGDGNGPPDEVWNCRCSMRDYILGFRRADGSISYVEYGRDRTIHDEQMEKEKERRANAE